MTPRATSRKQGAGLLPQADELPDAQPRSSGRAQRSYRELPLRLFEFGTVYRYEKSGVVHGLTRARGFTQDDAHIYCTREQMRRRARPGCSPSSSTCCATTGWTTSTSSSRPATPSKFVGDDDDLGGGHRDAAARWPTASGLELVPDPGGAAFYGPKISVQAKDAIGRTWQMSTIQLDFIRARAVRAGVHRARRHAAAAGDDPPRAVRLDRAVLRRPRSSTTRARSRPGWRRCR